MPDNYSFEKDNSDKDIINNELLLKYGECKSIDLRHQIVFNNFNLVKYIARLYLESGEPLDDLMQVGCIGLIKAIDTYEIDRNVKFSTYATHKIRGEIRHYIRDKSNVIKKPRWIHSIYSQILNAIEKLSHDLGHTPSISEIAKYCNIMEDGISEVLKAVEHYRITSLDANNFELEKDGISSPMIERIKSQKYISFRLPVEDRIVIMQAVEQLKVLEKNVIYLFFYKDLNQTEIAQKLGISQKHVSRLIKKSLNKLKNILKRDFI